LSILIGGVGTYVEWHFVESPIGSLSRQWITSSKITSIKRWNLTFDGVITLMDTFDEVVDGHIFDQLYGFRRFSVLVFGFGFRFRFRFSVSIFDEVRFGKVTFSRAFWLAFILIDIQSLKLPTRRPTDIWLEKFASEFLGNLL
jgi:hypothetical protein